jgi:hypothetical protein
VDIGRRLDTSFPGYNVEVVVKENSGPSTIIASDNSVIPLPGEFETLTLAFKALPGDLNLNKQLGIRFRSNGVQTNFDNVRLDANHTPEPTTICLVGLGILGLLGVVIRKRHKGVNAK